MATQKAATVVVKRPSQLMLEQAIKIVSSDRNKQYGPPEDNFQNIANMWNQYLKAQGFDIEFSPSDVAYMMILMKVARLATNPTHLDSITDVAGYAACAADCAAASQTE